MRKIKVPIKDCPHMASYNPYAVGTTKLERLSTGGKFPWKDLD
jgi:hypothetical protein